jgi:hypothetical protein
VNLFHLPTFPDSEVFTEFVREAVIKGSPTDRFETLEVTFSTRRHADIHASPTTLQAMTKRLGFHFFPQKSCGLSNVDRAMDTLKRKAVAINADSIIDVSCGAAPMVNDCWAAQKCTGRAISFSGPSPSEQINR